MPLFYQHNINENTSLAVWHIIEPEDFFLEKVHLRKEIHHPHKRLQHLAGRYLLGYLDAGFPLHLIEIADSNKPLLPDETYHFSISHCGDFAAAIISTGSVVGIDVELIQPKIEFIKHKFLTEKEQKLLAVGSPQMLTLLWSCKEAVYKWYGKGGVDFKKDILIESIIINNVQGTVKCSFRKEGQTELNLSLHLFPDLCLAWVVAKP